MTTETVLEAEASLPSAPEGLLEVAAVLEGTTHVSGIAWRLSAPGSAAAHGSATHRHGHTLVSSELAAVGAGLREALRKGYRRLRVQVPGSLGARLLSGETGPRYRRAASAARRLAPLIQQFESVRFEPVAAEPSELRRAAEDALDAGLRDVADREEERLRRLEETIVRARTVRLEREASGWIANGRYHVRLDPMHCDCPAWSARWARVSLAAKRAQRLPCKHLAALAIQEGIGVPRELEAMARRAVE